MRSWRSSARDRQVRSSHGPAMSAAAPATTAPPASPRPAPDSPPEKARKDARPRPTSTTPPANRAIANVRRRRAKRASEPVVPPAAARATSASSAWRHSTARPAATASAGHSRTGGMPRSVCCSSRTAPSPTISSATSWPPESSATLRGSSRKPRRDAAASPAGAWRSARPSCGTTTQYAPYRIGPSPPRPVSTANAIRTCRGFSRRWSASPLATPAISLPSRRRRNRGRTVCSAVVTLRSSHARAAPAIGDVPGARGGPPGRQPYPAAARLRVRPGSLPDAPDPRPAAA